MTDTTIPVSNEAQRALADLKRDGETWNSLMWRLMRDYEDNGKRWTEREIRDMVRNEIQQVRKH